MTKGELRATMLDMQTEPELDLTWRDLAACAHTGLDFFDLGSPQRQERLIAMCNDCDVQQECLDYAVFTNQQDGIWGGMRPDERRKHRRRVMDKLRADKAKARRTE